MARPTSGAELVEGLEGSAGAKQKLRLFLQTLLGERSIGEVGEEPSAVLREALHGYGALGSPRSRRADDCDQRSDRRGEATKRSASRARPRRGRRLSPTVWEGKALADRTRAHEGRHRSTRRWCTGSGAGR